MRLGQSSSSSRRSFTCGGKWDRRRSQSSDYIDKVGKQTGIAKVVGSGGGVLAGGLTLASSPRARRCLSSRGGPRPRKRPHRRLCCPVLLSRKQSHEWMLEQVRISAQRLCPHGPITSYHQLSLQSKYSATVQLKVRSAAIRDILSGDHRNSGNDTTDGWELKGLAGTWPECRQTRRLMVKHSDKWF